MTRQPSQPDMIQFNPTSDDDDWPDVPQQPLPARTPSQRSVELGNPLPVPARTPPDAKESVPRPLTAKRAMSELRKMTVSPAPTNAPFPLTGAPLEGNMSRGSTVVLDENAEQTNKQPKQASGRGTKKGISAPILPTRHTGTGSGTPSVNRRPPDQPQIAQWGRLSRDSTMASVGEDDGSLNIRPMSRYDTTPMRSKSRAGSKMSMLSLDSNADRTSQA